MHRRVAEKLSLGIVQVSVVYYRSGYSPDDYPSEAVGGMQLG